MDTATGYIEDSSYLESMYGECWREDRAFITFNGDDELKAKMVDRAYRHRIADRVVQGSYFEMHHADSGGYQFKGCAIGCLANDVTADGKQIITRHARKQETGCTSICEQFELPPYLGLLAEAAFEGQPRGPHKTWPEEFAAAIPVGVSLTNRQVRRWWDEWRDYCKAEGLENHWNPEAKRFVLDKLASITPSDEQQRVEDMLTAIKEQSSREDSLFEALIEKKRAEREAVKGEQSVS